jgi:transposase-like protein
MNARGVITKYQQTRFIVRIAMSIDYGMGQTNIDHATGIRYGVISQNMVLQSWADSSEFDYGAPTCPKCGEEAIDYQTAYVDETWEDNGQDYACPDCRYTFDSDEAYSDEPLAYVLDDGKYKAEQDSYGDIFVTLSPYYTRADFCSPCAPGACHLENPTSKGEKAYCFGPDWFDDTPCPYPVYRVDNDECIYKPE